jgi:hypothetical protein
MEVETINDTENLSVNVSFEDITKTNELADDRTGYCFLSPAPSLGVDLSNDMIDIEIPTAENAPATPTRPAALSRKSYSRGVSNASGIESIRTEDPHLGTADLWEIDVECHHVAREGYFQTPVANDGSTAVVIEEGCQFEHFNRQRANSANRARIDSTTSRSRADSFSRHQDEAQENPPPVPNVRRRNLHQRNHALDVSMLDSFDLETYTIKERRHGYVRP